MGREEFMRQIAVETIIRAVKESVIRANLELGQDVLDAFHQGVEREESPVGKEILERLIENARIAREEQIPICQDTGLAVIFAELGQEVSISGGDFNKAIAEGVRQGYEEGYLRKSVCGGGRPKSLPPDHCGCRNRRQLRKMCASRQKGPPSTA
jgi:fumarate hydratase subunit alpha